MNDPKKRVSVIIPARNEEKFIERSIRSIYANATESVEVEIIVVDGISDDGTVGVVEDLIGQGIPVTLMHNQKKITPVSMNLGIEASSGDFLMFSGAHAEYPSDYLKTCLAVIEEHPEAWCVGGNIDTKCDTRIGQAIADAMSSPFGVGNAMFRLGKHTGYVDTLSFGCYHRWVFGKVGLFDESLVRNQDDDMNLRVLQAGGKLYMDSRISSVYYSRSSLKQLFRQYWQYGYWRTRTLAKHGRVASFRQLIPALFVLAIVFFALIGILVPNLWYLIATLGIVYFFFLLLGTIDVSRRSGVVSGAYAPLLFVVLHFAYGGGFWAGCIALLFRKEPSSASKELSR